MTITYKAPTDLRGRRRGLDPLDADFERLIGAATVDGVLCIALLHAPYATARAYGLTEEQAALLADIKADTLTTFAAALLQRLYPSEQETAGLSTQLTAVTTCNSHETRRTLLQNEQTAQCLVSAPDMSTTSPMPDDLTYGEGSRVLSPEAATTATRQLAMTTEHPMAWEEESNYGGW